MKALQLLVTRPDPEGSELCRLLQERGIKAVHLPTLDFAPPRDPAAFERAIKIAGWQDWLIFMSPRAVYTTVPALRATWPEMPATVKFAAVGAGTAKALRQAGYLAVYPKTEWSSEGLLALPEFKKVSGQKIAIIRGEGGRDILNQALLAAGADITQVIAYQRIMPDIKTDQYGDAIAQGEIDAIICASFDAVKNMKTMLGKQIWPVLKTIPIIVVSERIKLLTKKLGFQKIWLAKNVDANVLLEVIDRHRK